jgi:hypothetical protein
VKTPIIHQRTCVEVLFFSNDYIEPKRNKAKQSGDDGEVVYEFHKEKLKHKSDNIAKLNYHHSVK